jgi:hypothetical protein
VQCLNRVHRCLEQYGNWKPHHLHSKDHRFSWFRI